jgi:hypothetical protein
VLPVDVVVEPLPVLPVDVVVEPLPVLPVDVVVEPEPVGLDGLCGTSQDLSMPSALSTRHLSKSSLLSSCLAWA